jgi:hypothetical protein
VWSVGARWHRARGRFHAAHAAVSWEDALGFLTRIRPEAPIGEVQFWGHGKWGDARIANDMLDERSLTKQSPLRAPLSALRDRLAPGALFWFRTCETFGADRGQRFARQFSDRLRARAAGHTYVIGLWQSGLHLLEPGRAPSWDPEEGLLAGNARQPIEARMSLPNEPNTITCFTAEIPRELAL